MGLRVCLVTPFAWSRPHDVNEHVEGLARELRALGHQVTVLAPSTRASDIVAGRRALLDGGSERDVIALGPALPVSRRSRIGVPVGVRANLALALERGRFDIVHGFEPGLPSLSYLALRDSHALGVGTFLSADRLGYPPGKPQRARLLSRIDALLATSAEVAEAAELRLPGDYRVVSPGVDAELFRPSSKRRLIVLEWRPGERLARSVLRELRELPDWELVMLRTKPLSGRPTIPRTLAGRASVRTARDGVSRAALLNEAAIFVPAVDGLDRVALEAAAAGAAIAMPPGLRTQPELAGAATARLAEDDALRERKGRENRKRAEGQTFAHLAREHDSLYRELAKRRRVAGTDEPLAGRDWIVCDLHLHTSWSHDCAIDVADLLTHAEAEGLGAIAITDHNVFGGSLEALATTTPLTVIPGEEVKTDGQGEVIGLFLKERIEPGMDMGETIAAIQEQGGLVYMPHPFDRLHTIPDAATLLRHLDQIDILEVYNSRLLFDSFNDDALRFATKYNLIQAGGSDAHVLPGIGTAINRIPAFDGPEEFLLAMRQSEILRRPKSLLYLQGLKWVQSVAR